MLWPLLPVSFSLSEPLRVLAFGQMLGAELKPGEPLYIATDEARQKSCVTSKQLFSSVLHSSGSVFFVLIEGCEASDVLLREALSLIEYLVDECDAPVYR